MMNNLISKAIRLDIKKEYLRAIEAYEYAIQYGDNPTIECFSNLAFIYWAFAAEENEFNTLYNIPCEMSLIGLEKYSETLNRGLKIYPKSLELSFWERYFSWRLYGNDFSCEECIRMIQESSYDTTLIPYFYVNLCDNISFKTEVNILRFECANNPVAKLLYISDFI